MSTMARIDGERLLADLTTLRSFGAQGTGVVRPTFSDPDLAARRWLRQRMIEAGLTAEIDGVGNVIGRSPNEGPALLVGSHADTQPTGGWLDGALGVIYGLEVARALADDPATAHLAVDPIAWSDEEGTYTSCLGSRSFVGDLSDTVLSHTNAAGETVAEAVARCGLADVPRARLDRTRAIGYVEAHIEQGPHLEEAGLRVGVVTSIVGIRAIEVSFTGEQNHAGTTPMDRRSDAAVALFTYGARLQERVARVAGATTVWTAGWARLEPGADSIIPGFAQLPVQFRDPSDDVLDDVEAALKTLADELTAEGAVEVTVSRRRDPITATDMDAELGRHLVAAAETVTPGQWTEMPSAAGHDPMVLADHLPCGMLFVPSIGGISHDFAEDTDPDDIVTGCEVLAEAVVTILSAATAG